MSNRARIEGLYQKIFDLNKDGVHPKDIGLKVDREVTTIYNILKRNNIPVVCKERKKMKSKKRVLCNVTRNKSLAREWQYAIDGLTRLLNDDTVLFNENRINYCTQRIAYYKAKQEKYCFGLIE